MKDKEKQTIKKTSVQDLLKEEEGLEAELKKIQMDRYVKPMKNSRKGRGIRKKIAVIKTCIKEKQLSF